MLSRSAQSLYWIGRHLERAGHLCQLLRLQSEGWWTACSASTTFAGSVNYSCRFTPCF